MQLVALFKLAFAAAPVLNTLTSLHIVTRRPVLQKVRHHPRGLCLLVSIGFQVLFHSPPGVLFTFPSRYYTLSVTRSYLALGDGPPTFPPDSSCPVVLRIHRVRFNFAYEAVTLFGSAFQPSSARINNATSVSLQPLLISLLIGLGSFPFAHHYSENR